MSKFKLDTSNLVNGMDDFESRADVAIRMYVETVAKDLESYAKEHRPWTDRTGAARQRLLGAVETTSTGYRVSLAHGVDYGIFLEMANEKKYAILEPTVRLKGPDAVKGMDNLLNRLGGKS